MRLFPADINCSQPASAGAGFINKAFPGVEMLSRFRPTAFGGEPRVGVGEPCLGEMVMGHVRLETNGNEETDEVLPEDCLLQCCQSAAVWLIWLLVFVRLGNASRLTGFVFLAGLSGMACPLRWNGAVVVFDASVCWA